MVSRKNHTERADTNMKKLGFIARKDLDDRLQWSGTIRFMRDDLLNAYQIIPIVVKESLIQKVVQKAVRIITHNKIRRLQFTPIESFRCQKMVEHAAAEGCKLFFAPAVSDLIAGLKMPANTKLIYLSDTTYHAMIHYYFFESAHDQKIGNLQESRALQNADEVIYSNDWAKNDAINYYGIAPKKLHVLPFGANLKDQYNPSKQRKRADDSTIHLLFCGIDWERKGAGLALECLKILNASDQKRRYDLTLIGLNAPEGTHDENALFVGHLNKNSESDLAKMIAYYQNSDVFILPTKAECSAVVFSEAAMYALPSFTYNTGGTATYVWDRVTGRCLPAGSTAEDFSNAIREMFDQNLYQKYSMQARKYYEEKLNWSTWVSEFKKIAK